MTSAASKWLPASLGSLFGQPLDVEPERSTLPEPPANLVGAFAAPELCLIVDQYRPDIVPADAVAEVKLDGLRCLHIGGRLWTREGSPFEAAEHCLPILRGMELQFGQPMFFDGEYVEDGGLEATLGAFRSKKGRGCLWLFDAVPLNEWKSGQPSRRSLIERKLALRQILLSVTERRTGVPVGIIDHIPVKGACEIEQKTRDVVAAGYEGIVVKSGGSRYARKRTCDWMKVKLRQTSRVLVLDMNGKTSGGRETCKSLLVKLPAEGARPMLIPVHGGLAETVWNHRDQIVGGLMEIEHCGFTGGGQPREAQLKQFTVRGS